MKKMEREPRFVDFAERVYQARKDKAMTQEALAEASDLSVASIRRVEAGRTVDRTTIEKLEDVLHIAFNPQTCTDIRSCPYAHRCLKEITSYLEQFPDIKKSE